MTIKYFHSQMYAAPALSGTAGALVSLLDTLLADGFDTKSMTTGAISSGVATLNFSGSHSSEVGSYITVSGATPSSLNGPKLVTAKTGTSVSFATSEANGSVTGTVSFKMTPLGWTKAFTATNVRAYQSSDVASTGGLLRVDDTGTVTARTVGYETMSDIDTGTGPFPTASQISGGGYWPKSSAADATAKQWLLVGDERFFYLWVCPYAAITSTGLASYHGTIFGFGDLVPYQSGDAYSCYLATSAASTINSLNGNIVDCLGYVYSSNQAGSYVPRSYTGLGSAVQCWRSGAHIAQSGYSGSNGSNFNARSYLYPNGPDNGLLVAEVNVGHAVSGGAALRGKLPGLYHSPQIIGASFATRDVIDGGGDFSGKSLMAVRPGNPGDSNGGYGVAFFDLTGPWR